jgi:predicted AlkP superfamily pyrophosphatase or phosphodiesterase
MTFPLRPRRLAALPTLAAGALLAVSPSKPPAAPEPKLAVVISVDGLSMSRLLAARPWFRAGLKRLLDEGRVEANARYRHINTETGPGHASLGTGAPPRVHGIVLNSWYEERPGEGARAVYCTDQAGPSGRVPGPANLRVPTLGDRLVETRRGSRVVSVSGKDRASIFLAGRNPAHAVFWYDKASGTFVTSEAYRSASDSAAEAAAAVARFNLRKAGGMLPGRIGLLWKRWDAPPPAANEPLPTPFPPSLVQRFQVPANGLGWEKDLSRYVSWSRSEPSGYFAGIYRSPLLDEVTADLVLDLLADDRLELGHRAEPDLLAIGFSGHDPVSHDYGPGSEEELDALRRLDVQIGRVLEALDREYPKGTVLVAFSADHGFTTIPEVARALDRTSTAGRLSTSRAWSDNVTDRLNRMLDDALCLDPTARPLVNVEGWNLFYRRSAFPMTSVAGSCGPAGRPVTTADVDRVLPRVVNLAYGGVVTRVFPVSQRASWPADDPVVEFLRNDFDAARSGDAFLIPAPGVIEYADPARGAMHGSFYESDTHVPLVFLGGPVRAGTTARPATPYDLAPTVGAWLGVALPDATGHALPLSE